VPTSTSWSILPPAEAQYQALCTHFSAAFHRWRVSCAIATTVPRDDLSYPPTSVFGAEDPTEAAQRAEAEASELESKISEHLHAVFAHWASIPAEKRTEIWTLELARGVGRKADEVEKLRKEKEFAQQETAHLRQQVEELSRLQHPREFKITPPITIPIGGNTMHRLGELGMGEERQGVGFTLMDRNVHLDTVIERAIGRWKDVVREARGGVGMSAQRSLSGEHPPLQPLSSAKANSNSNSTPTISTHPPADDSPQNGMEGVTSDQDADADADADMEEDDSFVDMDVPAPPQQQRAPEAHMALTPAGTNYRLSNGKGGRSNGGQPSMENQVVGGYVSIPAR
jgi:hypothetical protein